MMRSVLIFSLLANFVSYNYANSTSKCALTDCIPQHLCEPLISLFDNPPLPQDLDLESYSCTLQDQTRLGICCSLLGEYTDGSLKISSRANFNGINTDEDYHDHDDESHSHGAGHENHDHPHDSLDSLNNEYSVGEEASSFHSVGSNYYADDSSDEYNSFLNYEPVASFDSSYHRYPPSYGNRNVILPLDLYTYIRNQIEGVRNALLRGYLYIARNFHTTGEESVYNFDVFPDGNRAHNGDTSNHINVNLDLRNRGQCICSCSSHHHGHQDEILPRDCGNLNTVVPFGEQRHQSGSSYPWMAAVIQKKPSQTENVICGGTLIANRFVLTAVNCLLDNRNRTLNNLVVKLGGDSSLNTNCRENRCPSEYSVAEVYIHPGFNQLYRRSHDIALLRLRDSVRFTRNVAPICLQDYNNVENLVDSEITTLDWVTNYNSPRPNDYVQETSSTVRRSRVCYNRLNAETFVHVRHTQHFYQYLMCLTLRSQPNQCLTKSGGGSFLVDDGRAYLMGITSRSKDACITRGSETTVFVPRYVEFIKSIIRRYGNF